MKVSSVLQWLAVGTLMSAAVCHQPLFDWLHVRQLTLHPRFLPQPTERSTLCIGDSVAFGVGVQAGTAWPDRLAQSGDVDVRRAIAPRLHSSDALRQLPQWLHETHPDRVIIQLGADDAEVEAAAWAEHERVLLEVWLERKLDVEPEPIDEVRFAGRWRLNQSFLSMREDGIASIGDKRGSWRVDGPNFFLAQDGQAAMPFRWRFEGPYLVLRSESALQVYLTPESMSLDPAERIAQALGRGHWSEAELRIGALRRQAPAIVAEFEQQLDTLRGQPRDRPSWPANYSRLSPLNPEQAAALEQNLRDCARAARRAGATIVFVGHSPELADRSAIARRVAKQLGARYVSGPADVLHGAPAYATSGGHAAVASRL